MAHSATTYVLVKFKFEISVCFCSLLFTWACVCTMWSMELILNLNSSWTCGLSVIMYFSSDGVTQQVHMVFGVLVKRIIFYTRKRRKKVPKSFENHPKIDVWDSLGTFLESFYKHLGHMSPKDWIFKAFEKALGVQDSQLGSNLEAQRLLNRAPNPKKSMLKNNTFLASILEGFGPRFGRVFARFFGPKMHAKSATLNRVKS